jgi:hypothetical protein
MFYLCGKWRLRRPERHQFAVQFFEGLVAEPCADMTDVSARVFLAHRENERAEKRARSPGRGKPTITTSWRFEVLIFSQSIVRPPDT